MTLATVARPVGGHQCVKLGRDRKPTRRVVRQQSGVGDVLLAEGIAWRPGSRNGTHRATRTCSAMLYLHHRHVTISAYVIDEAVR